MDFTEIVKQMNKLDKLPVAVKVNEEWLEKQMQQNFILRDNSNSGNTGYFEKFTGVPVQIDNTISSFEFVYKESE